MSLNCKSLCSKVSLVLFFMLLFQLANAQYDFSLLDKKLNDSQKDLGKNVVALVYKDGKIIYKKELGEDFKANVQAPIASCSKWLTAALVMMLVDEGKLSLDDKVSTYLPIFATYGKGYITIRNCLSHETGIKQEQLNLMGILGRKKYATLEEEVNDIASKKDIDFNPGTGFWYGNVGLNIAARVCEVVSKRNFQQLALEKLFRPLSMRATTFANDNYSVAPDPSGGAKSTALDYMNFLSMILNKGMFNGKRILSEKSIEAMQTPITTAKDIKYAPKVAAGYNYGLGEWIQEVDANGKATVVSSPGLFGTWPMVDNCKGYACIVFVKTLLSEQKKEIYLDMKKIIDDVIPGTCN